MLGSTPTFPDRPEFPDDASARSRRLPRARAALLALGILAAAVPASAQTRRCDLVSRDTVIAGTTFKRCLDLDALDGTTITVPSNVTRIDNDGLSLCRSSSRIGGEADIAFVLDQSGSMTANYAWVSADNRDTTYYYGTGGCQNNATSGTVLVPFINTSVPRLTSRTGCVDNAGDPFAQRVNAYRRSVEYMDSISDGSTAGYIGFAGSITDQQSLLQLNSSSNLNTLRNAAVVRSGNGTNYTQSLGLAKRWLSNTSMRRTSKQAVIFISDGRPTQGTPSSLAYLDSLQGMPPVYTIFMGGGSDTSNFGRLNQLAQLTGGTFSIIPPMRPDSLVSVVRGILNLILRDYAPDRATVSNGSLSPVQSATAVAPADFQLQQPGSWLMRLDNIIGLRNNASNSITVSTDFRETSTDSILNRSITFTISTTGAPTTGSGVITTTQFARTCYDGSRLAILNGAGARPAALTEADSAYQLRLRTAPSNLATMPAGARTRALGDDETPTLANPVHATDSSVYRVTPRFRVSGTGTDGDGTLQSRLFDTVIATWTHPRDPQDFASDTLRVRAANASATAWFSDTRGGAPITSYESGDTLVYVVIRDQQIDPRQVYAAMITSERLGIDSESVALTIMDSLLVGQIRVSNLTKNRRDGTLQVSPVGDQLRVEYRDPVYGDVAVGTAGFDENVQEAARLEFTDENWSPLPPGTVWPPSRGKLYFLYSDDYAYGRVPTKDAGLLLNSLRYGTLIGDDGERASLAMVSGSSGSRATWRGSIDLADAFPPIDSNGRAEARYRGEAVASAAGHDNMGTAQAAMVSDSLIIAYPDSVATLSWRLSDTGTTPAGTEGLIITVRDQDFSVAGNDSAAVTVTCLRSGDSVSAIAARESASGTYVTGVLVKDVGVPSVSDRILSCQTADQIRITYVDPVFGTTATLSVEEVAVPVADPRGRRFLTEERVTLTTATPGATIWYTTDGTTPVPGVSPAYTGPIQVIRTTTIKAVATRPGWKNSRVMTEVYTKERNVSRIELLDGNGNEVSGGILAGSATSIRVKVTTTQAGLGAVQPSLATRRAGDSERPLIANPISLGNGYEYQSNVNLLHPSGGRADDDTVQATGTDTLIAVWTNPLDSADVARDTLVIRPAFKVSEVYFTKVPNGPLVTTYDDTQTVVYVVVKTIPQDPSLVYRVTVSATELGLDDEVLTLTQVAPGVFTAQVSVVRGAKNPDVPGTLQVSAGADQLTAVFVDPVFGGEYRGNAGFGQDVEESGSLVFVRADGSPVAPDEIWNPEAGKVYLRYSDDWLSGIDSLVHVRTAKIALVNRRSGTQVGSDEEDVTLTLLSQTATRGTWQGEVLLRDRASATAQNDTLETYYRGEATASITPHSNQGAIGGSAVTDQMVIAYPDKPAEIVIRDTSGGAVDRLTSAVDILVRDQQHTKTGDNSILVVVTCEGTGDRLQSVRLVWDGAAYVAAPPVVKGESQAGQSVSGTDSVLQCLTNDRIVVTYADPVFSETKSGDARWSDQKAARIWFGSLRDSSAITSVADGVDNTFIVFVEGVSPTRDRADTISVTLTTKQGERLVVKAVETGPLTGLFRAEVDYAFITRDPNPNDSRLEANINRDERNNRVIVTATAAIDGKTVTADLALFSAYNMVAQAWIKDVDGDGRADMAYFRFDRKLARLPSGLEEVAWNEEGESFRQKAGASMLSFLNADSSVVVADFTESPFGAGLTGIPDGRRPYALFPSDNLFGGQTSRLADSVGPVPLAAVKYPSNLNSYTVSATEKRFYPDTLVVRVSEGLETSTNWSDMARFSKGCGPYSESVPLKLAREPRPSDSDPMEWTLIVDNSPTAQIPLVGDCIFLENDGRYTDVPGNRPAPLGVELKGENPRQVIRDFRGFPPVAGMDPGSSGFVLVTNDTRKDGSTDGRWSTQSGNGNVQVIWLPPAGLNDCANSSDVMKCLEGKVPDRYDVHATPMREIENQGFTSMPVKSYSAVQVIATGRYIARVSIYDNFGVHVRSFVQAFGFWGEEKNPWRATEKGLRSFLIWDMKDKKGAPAGQGVYVWKVNFSFSDKKSEVMYTRTGVLRN